MSRVTTRLGQWWNAPTRRPLSEVDRTGGLLVLVPIGLVISGSDALTTGVRGALLGSAQIAVGLAVLAADVRWARKPAVSRLSGSTAAESAGHSATLRRLYELHERRDIEGALA